MRFHCILCATDFSEEAERAVVVAVATAARLDAELVLAHVSEGVYAAPERVVGLMIENEQRDLAAAVDGARRLGARRVSSQLLAGDPRRKLVELLHSQPAFDLVVLGTRGRSTLARVVLGSVADHVVRHAPCSVLVTRGTREITGFRDVMVAVDFSESSRDAVAAAANLLEPGGRITLCHVIPPPMSLTAPLELDLGHEVDPHPTKLLVEWAASLEAQLASPVGAEAQLGPPDRKLLAMLEADSFDLVVTGSHGRTGIRRALLGSVAESLVRHAPVPVLVTRSATSPELAS